MLQTMRPMLPALRITGWDGAHGSRRITKRPWNADKFIAAIVNRFVFAKHSIVRMIQNSPELSNMLKLNKSRLERRVGVNVANFSFRAHRYDSTQRPIGRVLLLLPAVILTAQQIQSVRSGTYFAQAASDFLEFITSECLLQLGMVADAGDENRILTLALDQDCVSFESIPWELELFTHRVRTLFVAHEALNSGYTKWTLDMLHHPLLVFVRGRPKMIGAKGGISQEIITRCFNRMSCWVDMAVNVINAEFPAFTILSSFQVFALGEKTKRKQHGSLLSAEAVELHIERLANFFAVDAKRLQQQYRDYSMIAEHIKRTAVTELCNHEAWRQAFAKRRHSMFRTAHPSDALEPVMTAWAGWHPTTSRVERDFHEIRRQCISTLMPDEGVTDILQVAADTLDAKHNEEAAIDAARHLWAEYFGFARRGGAHIKTKATSQATSAVSTEIGFIRQRREDTRAATIKWAARRPLAANSEPRPTVWDHNMEAEVNFQHQKRFKRLVRAEEEGQTLPCDLPANYEEEKQKVLVLKAQAEKRRKMQTKARNTALSLRRPLGLNLRRNHVFIADDISNRDALVALLQRKRAIVTGERTVADIFIAQDPIRPGQRSLWSLLLRGGFALTPEYITSAFTEGLRLEYKPAVSTLRCLWVSPKWAERHTVLLQLLEVILSQRNCKWTWAHLSIAEFCEQARRQRTLTGLVTPGDLSTNEASIKHVDTDVIAAALGS